MSLRVIFQARGMVRVTVALAVAYTLIMALVFYPPSHSPSGIEGLLFAEALFAGPMIIAGVLSILMRRVEQRRVIFAFQVGYIILTFAIFYSTFTGERDAQYQLALLLIPLVGFAGVVAAGLVAACLRLWQLSTHSRH